MKKTTLLSFFILALIAVLITYISTSFTIHNSIFKRVSIIGANTDSVLQKKIDSIELSILQLAKIDNNFSQNQRILDSIFTQEEMHQNLKVKIENEIASLYQTFFAIDSSDGKAEEKIKKKYISIALKKMSDKKKIENDIKIVEKTLKVVDSLKNKNIYDSLKKVLINRINSVNSVEVYIDTLLGKALNKHPDSIKKNVMIQSVSSKLFEKENDLSQIIEVVDQLKKRKGDIEKQNAANKDDYKKINKKAEPGINNVINYLANDTGNNFLSIRFNGSSFRCFVVSSNKYCVRIHNNTSKALKPLEYTWKQLKKEKFNPIVVMNGGMYNDDGSPVGVFIKDGKIVNPLEISEIPIADNFHLYPNGVFYVDTVGKFYIKKTADFKKYNTKDLQSVSYATQSGPMLLIEGSPNKAFSMDSKNLNIRNGVGIIEKSNNTKMVMAISDSRINFYNFSLLFKYLFGCKDALYMDGAISKMYVKYDSIESGDLGGQLGPIISVSKN